MLADRRQAYRESLREEILDATRQLLVLNGYEATSIRNIAAKVGCSPGILYHYFEDKPAIVAHLVRETFQKLSARLAAIREDSSPVLDRLRRALRAYVEFGLEHPHHYAILFMKTDSWHENETIMTAFKEDGFRTFSCLRNLSEEALKAGVLRPALTDPEELAQALWASIHGLVAVQIGCKGFPFVEQTRLLDRQVDILLAGIQK